MSELYELEKIAIERLKAFEPADGYYLAYSGGKVAGITIKKERTKNNVQQSDLNGQNLQQS